MSEILDSIISTVGGLLGPHGPATAAAAHSYAPGDFSVHFFLQLAVILLACRVVGWLGQKFLGQPQVVGEMIAGVVLGPSLLGLLFPHLQGMIFPKETKNVLYVGAQLGVGLYMFMVGTSFQADHFRAKAKSAASVSLAGIIAPFLIAVAIGASCDFLTPVGHQSNTLVMGPGGYKFSDYPRLGAPLSLLVLLAGPPLILMFWPLV